MARLYEYQGKKLLREAGLTTPEGELASSPDEVVAIFTRMKKPIVIKSQVWTTGRFKAGGIKFASTPEEARAAAEELFGARIKGFLVEKVLVEEKLDITQEFYIGFIVDASHKVRAPVMMFSTAGGIDVEGVGEDSLAKTNVSVTEGLTIEQARETAGKLRIDASHVEPIANAMMGLYKVFRSHDARSAEINPLVAVADGRIIAADCRVSVDDSSVARHPELGIQVARESSVAPTQWDIEAWKIEEGDYRGTSYFAQMAEDTAEGGYIGYHAIGGGGGLLAADMLTRHGLKLANFAETSGNPPASKVYRIARLVLSQPNLAGYCLMGAVLANQDQWHHALGLVKAFKETLKDKPGFPVVILIAGNKEREAIEILREGLEKLPIKLELYGREHLHRLDQVATRMKELVDEYKPGSATLPVPVADNGFDSTEEFAFRTGRVLRDESRCRGCSSLVCVKACSLFGGYLYRVKEGRMISGTPEDAWPRKCSECLACEYECGIRGKEALRIELPISLPG